jgi:quercetin 2,3-dioxygenase
VEYADSIGNRGVVEPGCAQLTTAGCGIVHQEMPMGDDNGVLEGFQLWINLPASEKMNAPSSTHVSSEDIPLLLTREGAAVHVLAGTVDGVTGPIRGAATNPEFLDVIVPPQSRFEHEILAGHTAFAYVTAGSGCFEGERRLRSKTFEGSTVLFDDGESAVVMTEDEPVRFLLCSAMPLNEPVAWGGPIVMNTQDELERAFAELREGTFIRDHMQ